MFLLLLVITPSIVNAGGPWPQPKSKGYFKLSEWWTIFDKHYTRTGNKDPNVTTGIFNTSLYAEYGFTNRITGIVNFPFFSRNYMNDLISETTNEVLIKGDAINSIGDFDIGLKYGLSNNSSKFPLSVSLVLGLPLGKKSVGEQGNLHTGDGEFNQLIQFDTGKGFNISESVAAYMSGYIGFNNRTQDYSEEIRYGFEFGVGVISQKLWISTKLNVVESLKNGSATENESGISIYANNTEYVSFALEANLYLSDRIGISMNTAGAFRGELIAAAPSYSFGVFYDMK